MRPDSTRGRRARPLAEVPVDVLCAGAEALAKEWLIVALEQEPLASAPSIAGAGLVIDGPAICEAVLRALADDSALEAIEPDGPMEPLVARAGKAMGACTAEEVSRAVEALRAVLWRAVRGSLPDEHAEDVALLAERLAAVIEAVRGAALRSYQEGDDRAWPAPLEEEVARSRTSGAPVSLLLVELEDVERLFAIETPAEARELVARLHWVVRQSVRPGDIVAAEPGGRAWVIAPGTDRAGAEELGSSLALAVQSSAPWRGAPLKTTNGVAALGEDASDAAGLIETAEERRLAAAASGIEISRRAPEPAA